jgi:hypothetical protein
VIAQRLRSGTFTPPAILMPGSSVWPLGFFADFESSEPEDIPVGQIADTTASFQTRLTSASVLQIHGIKERVKGRFRLLRRLKANHDNEGAAAANPKTVDMAIAFIDAMTRYREFFATLDDDCSAVIEFEDRGIGFFADITFKSDGTIECYRRSQNQPSLTFSGALDSEVTRQFLETELHIDF